MSSNNSDLRLWCNYHWAGWENKDYCLLCGINPLAGGIYNPKSCDVCGETLANENHYWQHMMLKHDIHQDYKDYKKRNLKIERWLSGKGRFPDIAAPEYKYKCRKCSKIISRGRRNYHRKYECKSSQNNNPPVEINLEGIVLKTEDEFLSLIPSIFEKGTSLKYPEACDKSKGDSI